MVCFVTNLLISTLADAINTVQREIKQDNQRHEFFNFISDRMKDILGIDVDRQHGKITLSMTITNISIMFSYGYIHSCMHNIPACLLACCVFDSLSYP